MRYAEPPSARIAIRISSHEPGANAVNRPVSPPAPPAPGVGVGVICGGVHGVWYVPRVVGAGVALTVAVGFGVGLGAGENELVPGIGAGPYGP